MLACCVEGARLIAGQTQIPNLARSTWFIKWIVFASTYDPIKITLSLALWSWIWFIQLDSKFYSTRIRIWFGLFKLKNLCSGSIWIGYFLLRKKATKKNKASRTVTIIEDMDNKTCSLFTVRRQYATRTTLMEPGAPGARITRLTTKTDELNVSYATRNATLKGGGNRTWRELHNRERHKPYWGRCQLPTKGWEDHGHPLPQR